MKIGTKLILGFVCMALLVGIIGLFVYSPGKKAKQVSIEKKEVLKTKKVDLSKREEVKIITEKESVPQDKERRRLAGTITMSGAWALYPMAVRWAEEYKKIHPEIKFDISSGGAGKGIHDAISDIVDVGMVSRDIYPEEIKKGAWWVSVTKDAVVPTINENNPCISTVLKRGIKKQAFIDIWVTDRIDDWKELFPDVNITGKSAISVYTRSDACGAAKTWAKYLGYEQEDLKGLGVYGDPGLAEAVRRDPLGIGYNNINYAYDSKTRKPVAGLRVIPIDMNNNGLIDPEEDFFEDRDSVTQAITAGVYPSPPARDLHFVSKGTPERKVVIEFIKWVLTDGQQYVPESGYINLTADKLEEELNKIRK